VDLNVNPVDIGILVIVGIFAVGGLRRGFMLGMVDLVAFGFAIVFAARMAEVIASPLRDWGLPPAFASGAGFIIAAIISLAVIGFALRIILAPLGAFGAGTPLGWVNSVLGLLPGAARGLAIAALILIFAGALPEELGWRRQVARSQLAEPIMRAGQEALAAGLSWAGIDPRALGGIAPVSSSEPAGLSFPGVTEAEPDSAAEQTLLDLINQERASSGLTPMLADPALAEVARAFGREMFELGLVSQTSPVSGTAKDRLAAAGLMYLLSGENIVLAPTARAAHDALMSAPAYRANILNPGFSRVGISAWRNDDLGLMVTQEFGS
jgi:uncharacterized protein YkwD/uncharacterized membrane protein required for colicin V production